MSERARPLLKAGSLVLVGLAIIVGLVPLATRCLTIPALPPIMRITEQDGTKARHLEVPIVSYRKGWSSSEQLQVDFIGAVHLGEAAYYAQLNKRFKEYDAVLFELVSDGEALPGQGTKGGDSILGTVQRAMSNLLGLSFQLDQINYQARNLVHADLSPQQLQTAMQARGESLPQLLIKLLKLSRDPNLLRSLEEQGYTEKGLQDINPLLILLRGPTPEERLKIKRFMAQGLIGSEAILKLLEGEAGLSLITDRNVAVISVLKREVSSGKRKIAIFYGVGHLPDLNKRLQDEMHLHLRAVEWLKAWNM